MGSVAANGRDTIDLNFNVFYYFISLYSQTRDPNDISTRRYKYFTRRDEILQYFKLSRFLC
jgi:hypothetical protein